MAGPSQWAPHGSELESWWRQWWQRLSLGWMVIFWAQQLLSNMVSTFSFSVVNATCATWWLGPLQPLAGTLQPWQLQLNGRKNWLAWPWAYEWTIGKIYVKEICTCFFSWEVICLALEHEWQTESFTYAGSKLNAWVAIKALAAALSSHFLTNKIHLYSNWHATSCLTLWSCGIW